MARLQKRKTISKKKRIDSGKTRLGNEVAASDDAEAIDGNKSLKAGPMGKKQKILSTAARAGGEPSALMKLVERYFGTWIQFLREVKVELLKVTWPSKKETVGTTVVVIVFVFVIAVFLGFIDIGLSSLIRIII
ncbi:MAG: preprotein translocase subunit SecE [Deltaproteobacteria bacterium]|nr:preprotein translocase subunit SecE [Deltaproteobacteria bacterium]